MSQAIRKIPLNLKEMQKNQQKLNDENVSSDISKPYGQFISPSKEQFQSEYNDEESPFYLKCKQNSEDKFNQYIFNSETNKLKQSQSTYFPSQLKHSSSQSIFQSPDITKNTSENNNQQQQKFTRRQYVQSKDSKNNQSQNSSKHYTYLETNKEKIDYLQQQFNNTMYNQNNGSQLTQKNKNPFQNELIANLVENSTVVKNNIIKQIQTQKINPAYKLDEQLLSTINQFSKKDPHQNIKEYDTNTVKTQDSQDPFVPVYFSVNMKHKNLKCISRTQNDLDFTNSPQSNKFTDKFLNNQNGLNQNEQQKLFDLYQRNAQGNIVEQIQTNNESLNDSTQSIEFKQLFNQKQNSDMSSSTSKMSIFKIKSDGYLSFKKNSSQISSETTECNTAPPKKLSDDVENSYQSRNIQGQLKNPQKSNQIKTFTNQQFQNQSLENYNLNIENESFNFSVNSSRTTNNQLNANQQTEQFNRLLNGDNIQNNYCQMNQNIENNLNQNSLNQIHQNKSLIQNLNNQNSKYCSGLPFNVNNMCTTIQNTNQNPKQKYQFSNNQNNIKHSNSKIKQIQSSNKVPQKQYQVLFNDSIETKNSSQGYANIFKSSSQSQLINLPSQKDLDEKIVSNQELEVNNQINKKTNVGKQKSNQIDSPFQLAQKKKIISKNEKDLQFCSYQNIDKMNANDNEYEDLDLYKQLSCNVIPDNQPYSNNNLEAAIQDFQQKNFIMRKIKLQPKQPNQKIDFNSILQSSQTELVKSKRSQSTQLNKKQYQNKSQIQLKEPVK